MAILWIGRAALFLLVAVPLILKLFLLPVELVLDRHIFIRGVWDYVAYVPGVLIATGFVYGMEAYIRRVKA